jgi:aarF domain-containing kinase
VRIGRNYSPDSALLPSYSVRTVKRSHHSIRTHHLSTFAGSPLLPFHNNDFVESVNSINFRRVQGPTDVPGSDESKGRQFILACSTARATRDSFLDRLLKWLRKWLKRARRLAVVTARTAEVVLRLSPLLVLTPAAVVSFRLSGGGGSPFCDLAWGYFVMEVQGLGPVAVKFCQWAATRRDIFPPDVCDRLSILHDRGYPHAWKYTHQVLTDAFGDYESKGLAIYDVIGCGSAAQVYRGTLLVGNPEPTGGNVVGNDHGIETPPLGSSREVAVKILHPRFRESVDRDLEFIGIVADFLNSLPSQHLKMLNLPRAVEEFSTVLHNQSDLTIEAGNLTKFRRNFYGASKDLEERSSIIFPQPIEGWVSPKVLVEDFVHDATPISDFLLDSSQDGMDIRRELAGPLLRAFLKMVFMDNFIHGDLHPVSSHCLTTSDIAGSAFLFL